MLEAESSDTFRGSKRPVLPGISTGCVPRRLKGKCVASCITVIPVAAVSTLHASAPRSQQTNNWTLGISYDGCAACLLIDTDHVGYVGFVFLSLLTGGG